MGQPGRSQGRSSLARAKSTRGTETSQYPEEEKATAIPLVAASERGPAQTRRACTPGGVGPRHGGTTPSRSGLERPARDGDRPVSVPGTPLRGSPGTRDTGNPSGSGGDHPPRLNNP